uniref:SHSP domain-containing protein n=1 Tax=Panagrolaimus sp. JU765 TaxID=591449 RepID=A0AC34PWK2_9BILA
MALWAYDPFRIQRRSWDPFHEVDHLVSGLFDDRRLAMPETLGQMKIGEDNFSYECNVAGFKPEELKVDIDGNELVISAEHNESNRDECVRRHFVSRVTIPEEVKKDTIQCDIDERGKLVVHGAKLALEDQKKRNIPIGFNKVKEPAAVKGK